MADSKSTTHIVIWAAMIIAVVVALIFSHRLDAQQNGRRDLTRPKTRIIGQWQLYARNNKPTSQFYFGKIGKEGMGVLYIVDPTGVVFDHRYTIVSEKRHGRSMRIRHFLSPENSRTEDLDVAKDGLTAQHTQIAFGELLTRRLRYIDAQTSPDIEAQPELSDGVTLPLAR